VKFSGRKVKAVIRSKGFRSDYIAGQVGITSSYLSTILSGKRKPGIKVLEELCSVLDCSINEFFLSNE
jgi:transcriptional regulator with XRE-family HTH domain